MSFFGGRNREPDRAPPSIPAGNGMRWEPIWEMTDEFWRQGLHHIWEPFNRYWKGRQPGFFKTENVVVQDHQLQLWSREDQPTDSSLIQNGYKDFSTAFIRTKHRQKYGYFEIYCKMMRADISSAFWFAYNEPNGGWWTEIDVFEYSTSRKNGNRWETMFNTNAHVHRNGDNHAMGRVSRPQFFDFGFDISQEPHKIALDWTEDYIAWYFDNKLIRKIENKYWHRPLHLQFDSETFPNWFGVPPRGGSHRNNLPNNFTIYYVRSWER